MKHLIKPIFLILYLFLFGFCTTSKAQNTDEKMLLKTFKHIIKTDQSHIRNNSIREVLILNNFETIKSLLADSISLNPDQYLKKRTRKKLYTGLMATFIHTLQTAPNLLLNDETLDLFAEYIDKNLLRKKELNSALKILQYDTESNRFTKWTEYSLQRIPLAREKWKLD